MACGSEFEMEEIDFIKLCNYSFGKILSQFSFLVVRVDSFRVRYESDTVYIEISYDEREGEIFVYLGRMINAKYSFDRDSEFTLNELLLEIAPEKTYKSLVFRKTADILNELNRLSSVLLEVGKDILSGKVVVFAKLLENRKRKQEEQKRIDYLADVRDKATLAFKNNDYRLAVSLYGDIQSELAPLEKKRYEIAMKKLQAIRDR